MVVAIHYVFLQRVVMIWARSNSSCLIWARKLPACDEESGYLITFDAWRKTLDYSVSHRSGLAIDYSADLLGSSRPVLTWLLATYLAR
jgi:hypothetical protein